jgi:hypothetical protein
MTEHLSFEQLCDFADDRLDTSSAGIAREHLATCAECAEQLTALRAVTTSAAALPKGITPPETLWADIRREIAPLDARRPWARSTPWLAAAGLVIAVGSSALTYMVMRGNTNASPVAQTAPPQIEAPELPARLASNEVRYRRDIDVLQRTLAERRDSLAPSTVETIERSLRVADSAIAEARAALAHDPANEALVKLFASNYERKIDLLKRAAELTPRT